MKSFIVLNLTAVFLLSVLLLACSKNNQNLSPTPDPLPELPLLESVNLDADNYLSLEYDKKIVSKLVLADHGFSISYQFAYNAAKKPSEGTVWGTYKMHFIYDGNLLQKIEYSNLSTPSVIEGYLTFTYAGEHLVQTTNYYIQGDSFLQNAKTAYTYFPNGDVKTIADSTLSSTAQRFILEKRTTYEYDAKPSAFKAPVGIFYALHLNPTLHNITKETVYNGENQLAETNSYQYQYRNNSLQVKTVKTIAIPGSGITTKNITYIY